MDDDTRETIERYAANYAGFAIAAAILELADAQRQSAAALRELGFGDVTRPGALEGLTMHLNAKLDALADALVRRGD